MIGRIPTLLKRSEEKYAIGLQYITPDLEEGEYISLSECTISPSEVGGLAKVGAVVVENDQVSQFIEAGVMGNDYYVKFKTTTSGGNVYEDSIFVKVREH